MFKSTKEYEGLRLGVYIDSTGHRTIGYGHNLDGGSDGNVRAVGAEPDKLRAGAYWLTLAQADVLFELDMKEAIKDIRKLVPNYDELPDEAQTILNDLIFNMGFKTLSTFKNTLKAFNQGDWQAAANGLERSKWYKQVKRRAIDICESLRAL